MIELDDDGDMVYPSIPTRDGAPPRTRKVIVSIEYTMMTKCFASVSCPNRRLFSIMLTYSGFESEQYRVCYLERQYTSEEARRHT